MADNPTSWPNAKATAAELRRRGCGGVVQSQFGELVRAQIDDLLIDAANLLDHMAVHLEMIADEKIHRSPMNLQELRAAYGLGRENAQIERGD